MTRLDDMLERYGEVCTQRMAAKILSINPRTIFTMLNDGRLRRIGKQVDVRSICDYLERPYRKHVEETLSESEFLAAARSGRWAGRR